GHNNKQPNADSEHSHIQEEWSSADSETSSEEDTLCLDDDLRNDEELLNNQNPNLN
ncbi:hypothetical protein K1T71_015258, partial [Dendrolimus kikuchii]